MPFHPTGEASRMYSKYDEAQFHLRLPHELHAKIKQRAKMNNRSMNSEIIAAIEESLAKQSSASVYIDDAERMAEQQSDMVKKIVFDTLKELYKKRQQLTISYGGFMQRDMLNIAFYIFGFCTFLVFAKLF